MSLGAVLWRVGDYDQARQMLDQASDIVKQKGSSFTALEAEIDLVEAEFALSSREFADAEAKAKQALDLAGSQDKQLAVKANTLIGLAQARSGRAASGLATCQRASESAASLGDPLFVTQAQACVGEAALLSGDAQRAIESTGQAQTFFSKNGLVESNWRASLITALANEKLLNHENAKRYLKEANDAFASLETKWGGEAFKSYQTRPDIQFFRKQLEQISATLR